MVNRTSLYPVYPVYPGHPAHFLVSAVANRAYGAMGHSMEKVVIDNDNDGLRKVTLLHELTYANACD